MAVEIYLEPELEEMVQNEELNDEWVKQCESLGLEGQLSLIKKKDDGTKSRPSPYSFMTETMQVVYATLCPVVTNYKNYNKTTIPIEVLGHIALCEKEGYFDAIKIWYDDTEKDPLVVGYIRDGHAATKHLIARFGAEVLPYEILKERAVERITEKVKAAIKKANVETMVQDVLERGNSHISSGDIITYNHKYI
jgi:hypothetical protein